MSNKSSDHLFVRIVTADYYITTPNPAAKDPCYSEFRSNVISQIPVIRIFGPTYNGIKACVHVHGIFPYIFIPNWKGELLDKDLYQLASSLDKAINVSLGNSSSNNQHVYNITQVYGRPFYGYHSRDEKFIKILFYNPIIAKRAADLLQNGTIFSHTFQPYEAHIPFVLQFFIDNNLYGMSFIKLSSFQERFEKRVTENVFQKESNTTVSKQTYSYLEVDVTASDIINGLEGAGRISSNPGLAQIFEEERKRCNLTMEEGKSSNINDGSLLINAEFKPSYTEKYFRLKLKEKLETVLSNVANHCDETVKSNDHVKSNGDRVMSNEIVDEERILQLTQKNANLDVSYSEFTSQGKDVLQLLQNLVGVCETETDYSDDIILPSQHEAGDMYSSQLILKQTAENDSILGNYISSDDEGDKDFIEEHTENRSDFRAQLNDPSVENAFISDEGKRISVNKDIPQLDGTNDSSSEDELNENSSRNKIRFKLRQEIRSTDRIQRDESPLCSTSRLINLADNGILRTETASVMQNSQSNLKRAKFRTKLKSSKSRKYDEKSYKTMYPQLKINIQKSPKKVSLEMPNTSDFEAESSIMEKRYSIDDYPATVKNNEAGNNLLTNSKNVERAPKLKMDSSKSTVTLPLPSSSGQICTSNYNDLHDDNSNDDNNLELCRILTAKSKAPSKDDVIRYLSNNCLPIVKIEQPFYDDLSDTIVKKNICGKTIKIDSKLTSDLEEFHGFVSSALQKSRYIVFHKSCDLSQIGPDTLNIGWLTSERSVVIGPVKNAPTYREALTWSINSKENEKTSSSTRNMKTKKKRNRIILVTAGMYGESDDDNDAVISLSPTILSIANTTSDVEEILSSNDQKSSQDDNKRTPLQPNRCKITDNTSRTATPSFLIDCVTAENSYGFALVSENLQDAKDDVHYQYVTAMSMEVFVKTRGKLNPDPEYDSIEAVFYSIVNDVPSGCEIKSGIILIGSEDNSLNASLKNFYAKFTYVDNEEQLLNQLIITVRQYDPDMLIGYEVEMLSWGYVIHRGIFFGMRLDLELSRVKVTHKSRDKLSITSEFKFDQAGISGRILLNIWRLLRHEVTLQSYSFENIMNHVLHQRVPHHSFASLTTWWCDPLHRWLVIDYYLLRVECTLQILQHLDFIGRTSELARLFGIQFYEVLSRGSQFRVESMMLRMAKPQNYVAASPSIQQRSKMRAPETVPLIMEPESRFYTDPVIVLDFQSLYPSMIIAYNYCFSTCLGRAEYLGQLEPYEFGCLKHFISPVDLKRMQENLHISPCGVVFVNKSIQTGVLPAMLDEILKARLLVKKSMKENKENSILQRVLHARQLGLKLIANVTYGYTAASFSGRMPCIEVGDSVVSKGRETLERAIELISKNEKWKARVIYGDTDSLFVMVPGRSKAEAFEIGKEMADAVTFDNPKPVKLKFEKVYQPCILQTKKRYVGYMYETLDQDSPIYDAKGIETVRRDGCPAVSKILEKSLKLLFETCNISLVKRYVQRQFEKLISGHVSIQELTFAREYRGLRGYRPTACVPALKIAREALLQDRRSEPRIKERVRYLISAGHPGMSLINLVRTPEQFIQNPNLRFNAEYYITRVIIPPLDRCFSLLAVNVLLWYTELPRKQLLCLPNTKCNQDTKKAGTISQYFYTSCCLICHKMRTSGLCEKCVKKTQTTVAILSNKINTLQRKVNYIEKVCQSCCGNSVQSIICTNLDCNVLYRMLQSKKDVEQVTYIEQLIDDFF